MDNKNFALGKVNFIMLVIAIAIIVIGFCLMAGGATTEESGFNPAIFNTQRIVIAPLVTMIGFATVVVAILKKSKD